MATRSASGTTIVSSTASSWSKYSSIKRSVIMEFRHPDAPLVEARTRRGREMTVLWYPIEVLQFMDNQRVKFNEQDTRMTRGILKVGEQISCLHLNCTCLTYPLRARRFSR